jgi:cell division septation protein DedD
MKKYIVLCAGAVLAMSLTSCGSSEKAYRQAYDRAQAAQQQQAQPQSAPTVVETPVVTPVQTVPSTQTQVTDNSDNVSVRQERVTIVSGSGLLSYSVVVGSFSVIANAEGLQQRLRNAGYAAQIVRNEERNMYRVVASTFNNKNEAVLSRDQLRSTYPDAWLLYNAR